MNSVQSKTPDTVLIPLSNIIHSKLNMRSKPDSEMTTSILEHGLLHPLLVYIEDGTHQAFAGGRRLAGCMQLLKDGKYDANEPIPCKVYEKEAARALSLVENSKRRETHPSDECRAVVLMVKDGKSDSEISAALSITDAKLLKYKRLGNLSKLIFKAWAASIISTEQAMAYASTPNKSLQKKVWDNLGPEYGARHIKNSLEEGSISSNESIVIFVGIDNYKDAKGKYTTDLFSEETILLNRELVVSLANQKLAKLKDLYIQENPDWKWVETLVEAPRWDAYSEKLHIKSRKMTDVESTQYAKLVASLTAIDKKIENTEEYDSDLESQSEKISDAISHLQDHVRNTTPIPKTKMKQSGVFIFIGDNGQMNFIRGVYKQADLKERAKIVKDKEKAKNLPNSCKPETPSFSSVLTDDIAHYKANIAKSELLNNQDLAIDALHFSLAVSVLTSYDDQAHDIRINVTRSETSIGDYEGSAIAKKIETARNSLSDKWIKDKNPLQAYLKLSKEEKADIVTYCSAVSLWSNSMVDVLLLQMKTDIHKHWRPTSDNYFSRVKADQLVIDAKELKLYDKDLDSKTKKDLVEFLSSCFKGGKLSSILKTWMPAVFHL